MVNKNIEMKLNISAREEFEKYKNKYLELSKEAIDTDPYKSTYENSYELLYGRTGYLIGNYFHKIMDILN